METFLNIHLKFTAEKDGIPKGSFLVLSRKGIKDCHSEMEKTEGELVTPAQYKSFLKHEVGWVQVFKMLVINPEQSRNTDPPLTFDQLAGYVKTFHIFSPIVLNKEDPLDPVNLAVKKWLHFVEYSKIPVELFEEIIE